MLPGCFGWIISGAWDRLGIRDVDGASSAWTKKWTKKACRSVRRPGIIIISIIIIIIVVVIVIIIIVITIITITITINYII